MSRAPETVDDAIALLGESPTTNDVYEETLPFSARDLAASAIRRVLVTGGALSVVGTSDNPITDADTARPDATVVYWICANGVTPSNALAVDLIFTADA